MTRGVIITRFLSACSKERARGEQVDYKQSSGGTFFIGSLVAPPEIILAIARARARSGRRQDVTSGKYFDKGKKGGRRSIKY